MDNFILILVSLGIALYFIKKWFFNQPVSNNLKLLQGPTGWPLIGNINSLNEPLWLALYKYSKQYGPIFKYTMGRRDIVVLSSSKMLFKTLKEQGNNFAGRFQSFLIKARTQKSGILFTEKEWWATQRSFALKVLKDFGFGKQRSQEIVNSECTILLKDIEEGCGKVVSARSLFPKATVNVIAKLVMNMRFESDSKDFTELTRLIEKAIQNNNFFLTIFQMYPILDNMSFIATFLLWLSGRNKTARLTSKFMNSIIDDHKNRFNIENEGEDFIDIFLKEQHKLNEEKVENHTFTDQQLIRVVLELFFAGYETTSTTLSWSMLLLAKHPEIQEKVHREIVDLLGTEKIPNFVDKKSLQYTQAVMDEILRVSTVVPLSISHKVFESTEVDGIYIPKHSIIFPNLFACHRDENVWEKPFEFYPEHFLKTNDSGQLKYTPRDELVPFSIGKRQCLGEGLARMEFFIFLTGIIQKFKIKFEKEMSEETFAKITRGTDGGIRAPLNSDVVFEMRM